ncbi:MAG: DUF1203 domain-containing protein [Pseudomonadota bacterium]
MIRYEALPTETARAYQRGAPDAYGAAPERAVSTGGAPCRHCLCDIPVGAPMLILAHRPFPETQPYAETGPIFLCAHECERHPEGARPPAMFLGWPRLLIRGYGADHRIVYGTGRVVETAALEEAVAETLEDPAIAYVHLRSASNNCYQARAVRAA